MQSRPTNWGRPLRPWIFSLFATLILMTLAHPVRAEGVLPPPGEYAIDANGSKVGFKITEFLVNTVNGKFTAFSGKVTVGDALSTSRVEATVDVASIDTGVQSRNEHLRGPDYFDGTRFPRMKFTSTAIWGTPHNFGIKGNLTIKSVTKEVTFSARIQDDGIAIAETTIDRTDFGITAGGVIRNDVHLSLRIHMILVHPNPANGSP